MSVGRGKKGSFQLGVRYLNISCRWQIRFGFSAMYLGRMLRKAGYQFMRQDAEFAFASLL
jgi:hypothetical protein